MHAPVMPSLPGLVPRPLTLAKAVAEAVTLAAYKAGSTDNLAALVVDLQPDWRSSSRLRKVPTEPQSAAQGQRFGEKAGAGPEVSGEGAHYSLPWHSTGLIVPQQSKGFHKLKGGPPYVCRMASGTDVNSFHPRISFAKEEALQAIRQSACVVLSLPEFVDVAWQALAMCTNWRSWWHWSRAEQQLLWSCHRPGLQSAACRHHTSRRSRRHFPADDALPSS